MVIDRHPKIGITHTIQYNSWKASRTGQEEPKWTIWMRSWHARKSHYSQHSHLITLTVMTRPDHRCKHHCNGNWLSTLSATSHHPKTLCVNYLLRILYSRYLLISFHKLYKPRWFIEDRLLCVCMCDGKMRTNRREICKEWPATIGTIAKLQMTKNSFPCDS